MNRHTVQIILAAVAVLAFSTAWGQSKGKKSDWQDEFELEASEFRQMLDTLYQAGFVQKAPL